MRFIYWVIPLFLLAARESEAQVQIARGGRAVCEIVTQPGASASERHAAEELVSHLKQITGADFPIREVTDRAPEAAILIGPGAAAARYFPDAPLDSFGEEELIMRTSGRRLLLAGGRPRGTLYAVYRFLHEQCGVRWWTPWASTVPKKPNLRVGRLDVRKKPAFESRAVHWFHAFDGDWAARNLINSHFSRLDEKRGGRIVYEGFVHTFYPLVPPEKHFQDHPEWYSLVNGKRIVEGGQLCTTNPQLRDFIVQRVKEWLRANPEARIVSVSQNDWYGACTCESCKAVDDAEGSHSGTMLALTNYVAEKIESEFPHVAVDTLAYQYTRKPPKTIRPRPNVIVRLCSIECDFSDPLEDPGNPSAQRPPANASFADDIRGWSRVSNRLYIWDYTTNFVHYPLLHPNYYTLGPNVRFFHKHGTLGMFEQGAYQSTGGEGAELKTWLLAQLLWDPYQDDRKLIREFCEGYYGRAASGPLVQYLDLLDRAADPHHMGCHSRPLPFALKTLTEANALLNQAESAARAGGDFLWRIQQMRAPLWYAVLVRWKELRAEAKQSGQAWPFPESRGALADAWLQRVTGPGPAGWQPMTLVSEGGLTPQQFVSNLGPDPAE